MTAGRPARVDLMRWSPVAGTALPAIPDRALHRFEATLAAARVPAAVRDPRGRDIDAACGQPWRRDLAGLPAIASSPRPGAECATVRVGSPGDARRSG